MHAGGMRLRYQAGTIVATDVAETDALPEALQWDERSRCYRARACDYASVVLHLLRQKQPFVDDARNYEELPTPPADARTPRPYQEEALAAWTKTGRRGVVVLPTGAGKTHLATMAMAERPRSTLVVAPTLDLVRQWHDLLEARFGGPIGIVGGGDHRVEPITVTTYDSAYLHMDHLGNRFGLVVFDEVHHLPSEAYRHAATSCLAPFRLGLTATPERTDGREATLVDLVGPIVYRKDIVDIRGEFLADYDIDRRFFDLTPDEREAYEEERALYIGFLRAHAISLASPDGWGRFLAESSRTKEGRRAFQAFRAQRALAFAASEKFAFIDQLFVDHAHDRMLLFTQDNATAYRISERCLAPVITHRTRPSERIAILRGLAEGRYGAVVTSRVLNEGVDVPDANVAVIVSGSGSVREHVQRLGRILRKREGKHARLYELVTAETSEARTSDRRREHSAYR